MTERSIKAALTLDRRFATAGFRVLPESGLTLAPARRSARARRRPAWSSRSTTGCRPWRPSGLLYYTGNAFPQWRGSFLVGALKWQGLVRVDVGPNGASEERFQDDSGDGEILRISPTPGPD